LYRAVALAPDMRRSVGDVRTVSWENTMSQTNSILVHCRARWTRGWTHAGIIAARHQARMKGRISPNDDRIAGTSSFIGDQGRGNRGRRMAHAGARAGRSENRNLQSSAMRPSQAGWKIAGWNPWGGDDAYYIPCASARIHAAPPRAPLVRGGT